MTYRAVVAAALISLVAGLALYSLWRKRLVPARQVAATSSKAALLWVAIIAGVPTLIGLSPALAREAAPKHQAAATPTFADEFNGSSLDTVAWAALDRPGEGALECFTSANAAVTGGNLVLATKVDSSCATYTHTTAMVQMRSYNFTYGTIEIRAKEAGGKGPWPALWLLGANCQVTNITTPNNVPPCNWPAPGSDEIDITEILNSDPFTVWQALHSNGYDHSCTPTTSDTSQNFHIYTLDWQPASLVWKIDGTTTCKVTTNVPSHPMFLIMSTGLNSNVDDTTLPQYQSVDYVRVYSGTGPACLGGALSANKASPQALNTAVTFTASASGCVGTQYQFYVYGQGTWTLVQPYSSSNTWNINYAALSAYGTYTIDVWIRSTGSPNAYDTFGLMAWVVGGCNFATTAAAANVFTTTAGGVACANPEYKVWIVGKGKPFFIAQDWTSNNVFTLNAGTLGLTTNSYTVDVWVREHGVSVDPNYFETWGLALFINGAAPCSATPPTLTASPLSPASTGTTTAVLFTATGCGLNAQYEYWLYPGSGGGFQLLQGFSTTATYTWHPAALGLYAHNYSIVVWAKAMGSVTPDYDSYALYSYELNGCTVAAISVDKSNPQAHGTTVNLTVTAAGCANPEFNFWILPSGGSWSNPKPYSSSNTLAWTPASAGNYGIIVWVREKGGPTPNNAYESYAAMSFTAT